MTKQAAGQFVTHLASVFADLARQLASPRDLSVAIPGLTGREHRVLSPMSSGYTNTAIHERLGLSPKTVRNYISVILTKRSSSSTPAGGRYTGT